MISLEQLAYETEDVALEQTEKIDREIVDIMQSEFNINFSKEDYKYKMFQLIFNPYNIKYRYRLVQLLEEKNYNLYALLYDLVINKCCPFNPEIFNIFNVTIESWLQEGESVTTEDGVTTINTKNKIFTFQCLHEYVADIVKGTEYEKKLLDGSLIGSCHDNAFFFSDLFPQCDLVTIELPDWYGKYNYHSYIVQDSMILDCTYNLACPKEEFDSFFNVKDIYTCPKSEFYQRYAQYSLEHKPNDYAPLLQLALNEKRKTYR